MAQLQQSQAPLKTDFLSERLRTVAGDVESALEALLPPPITCLNKALRYCVLEGGKRLRPFLVIASSQLFGVSSSQAVKAAAAVELIHAYSLVHDDLPCMDNADFRRGKPSCHKIYGEATAVLVGDALIPLAFQALASLETSADVRLKLIQKLTQVIGPSGLVAGQMMDLGQEGSIQSFEDLLEQERLKTGVLFGFAAEAGAILGKASALEQQALKSYGLFIGEAFQMVDDWLDYFGDIAITGKPSSQDAAKLTFLSLLGSEALYEKAHLSAEKAIHALSPFDERASSLRELAFYIIEQMK